MISAIRRFVIHAEKRAPSVPGTADASTVGMRINEIMSKDVIKIAAARSIAEAREEMKRARIHHVVVVDAGRVVGVVSDRDLAGSRGNGRTIADVMARDVVAAKPSTTVRQAANLMRGRTIGCLPVFDDGRLVGIVTTTDLLDLIGRGAERPVAESTRWTMRRRAPNRRAEIARAP
jgi:acetoin utilization protein AcuB